MDLKQVAANAEVDLKRNDVFVEQISLMFLSSAKHPCQLAEVHVATFFARVCFFFAQSWISGGGWWWRTGRPAESTTAGHGFQRSAACQLPSFFHLLLVILVLKRVSISVLVAVAVRVSVVAHCLKGDWSYLPETTKMSKLHMLSIFP